MLVVKPADASDGIGQMRENLRLVAEVTGTSDRAQELLAAFDEKLDEGARAIAAAGLEGEFNEVKAITWLSGSTYGVTFDRLIPLVLVLVLVVPLLVGHRRELDLLALDDDTPRVLGVRLVPTRLLLLGAAVALTAFAVASVGVIGFVGLVAPHAARAVAGSRHARVIPIAMMLGATVVSLGDTLGRTVIAPAQLPAGRLTALIGTPYFVWLLWRARAPR